MKYKHNLTAILECTEPWNKETQTIPKYKLTFQDKTWEFRAHHRGDASQHARWYLDVHKFGAHPTIRDEYIQKNTIPYVWEEDLNETTP